MAEVNFQVYWSKTKNAQASLASGMAIAPSEGIKAALKGFGDQALNAAKASLYRAAETIMTSAKKLTPVDTGNLKNSGHVQPAKIEGQGVTVVMGFGGPAVGYALPVHERLDVRHVTGQAKYLETPVLAFAPTFEKWLAADLRQELRRAGR